MAKTIMVVDDSSSLRQVVGSALRSAGYEVLEATDGAHALDRLRGQPISLVVCDVHMPKLDGISFVREMKERPQYRATPVIMLSTETDEGMKRLGQMAGAKAWVAKPFKPEVLLGAVDKLVLA